MAEPPEPGNADSPAPPGPDDSEVPAPPEPDGSGVPAPPEPRVRSRAARLWRGFLVGALTGGALVGLWGLAGHFLLPELLQKRIAEELTAFTGRAAQIGRVEMQPYALRLKLHDLFVGAAPDSAVRIGLLDADLSWRSLRRLAPVFDRLRIENPDVLIVRDATGGYDGADVVERLSTAESEVRPSQDEGDKPPPRFSLANIELTGGRLRFDDRSLDVTHEASDIAFSVPFISSLPVDQEIEVEPGLAFVLDGAPIRMHGRMLPFDQSPRGELQLALESLDLTRWLAHLPEGLPVRLAAGAVASTLTVEFSAPHAEPARVRIRGSGALGGIELRQPDGTALLAVPAVELQGIDIDPLGAVVAIESVTIRRPHLTVRREADQQRFFESVLAALDAAAQNASAAGAPPAATETRRSAESGAGLRWSLPGLAIEDGRIDFDDRAFGEKPLTVSVEQIALDAKGLSSDVSQPTTVQLSAVATDGVTLSSEAQIVSSPLDVDGHAQLAGVALARWAWLAGPSLKLDVQDGTASASIRYRAGAGDGDAPTGWSIADGRVVVEGFRALDGKREVVRFASMMVAPIDVDGAAQKIRIGDVRLERPQLTVRRDAKGGIDATGWWRATPQQVSGRANAKSAANRAATSEHRDATDATAESWQFEVAKFAVADGQASLEQTVGSGRRAEAVQLSGLGVQAGPWSSGATGPIPVQVVASLGKGRLDVQGSVSPQNGATDLRLKLRALPVPLAQPWIPDTINLALRSGSLSADGRLRVAPDKRGALRGGWEGSLALADFGARLRTERSAARGAVRAAMRGSENTSDLIRWKSIRVARSALQFAPFKLDVGDVRLDGLRARLYVDPEGRFNLQNVFAGPGGSRERVQAADALQRAGKSSTSASQAHQASNPYGEVEAPISASDTPPAQPVEAPRKTDAPPVSIGRIVLADAAIDFSDYFVRPNYSAHLTDLSGSVGAMAPGKPGDIDLKGQVDRTGAIALQGRIDPIGEPLFLDLHADAADIDLPALTPYSAKYVGYGIEKGKLSAKVSYQVVDGQLTAQNKVILDQLTFGEQVDSPDALKAPVLFAVSLLKDANGVIDVDLPISGSLDDPQFSIAGLVMRMIGNLIVRVVTAPFALIGSLIGGSGADLSSIVYAPASDVLDETARERLGKLAQALNERPNLKLELGGRITAADQQALRREKLDARLDRIDRSMGTTRSANQPIAAEARARLVEQAWLMGRNPRPPASERPDPAVMEQALLDAIELPEGELRELANRRAQAAQAWLANDGGIARERLFLTAARVAPTSQSQHEAATRSDDSPAPSDATGVASDGAGAAAAGRVGTAVPADAGLALSLK